MLQSIGALSLVTSVYAAGMATVRKDTGRFFANLFLSRASLVLVGRDLHSDLSLTGSLCFRLSAILSLVGFGLSLRALEARFGRLPLTEHHGLYEHSPMLAVCFLLTGPASVGFPGTIGFISAEILSRQRGGGSPYVGAAVGAATVAEALPPKAHPAALPAVH